MISRELILRKDISTRDKYIIEILNHYRRKINFFNSLKSCSEMIDNYGEIINKGNFENNANSNCDSNNSYADYLSYENCKEIENELLFNNRCFSTEFYIKYRVRRLFELNYRIIQNFKNNSSNYDVIPIENQIKQLIMDFCIY